MLPSIPGAAFRLSAHALDMMAVRNICPMAVATALDGRRIVTRHSYIIYYAQRVCVIVSPNDSIIVTCHRISKHQIKQELSR